MTNRHRPPPHPASVAPPQPSENPRPPPPAESATAAAQRIYWQLQTSRDRNKLNVARKEYLKAFGRAFDDEKIGYDFQDCVGKYFGYTRPMSLALAAELKLPAPIALAYYLRSVARPGKLPRSLALDRQDSAQMEAVRAAVAEGKMQRVKPGKALDRAIDEVARTFTYQGKRDNLLTKEQMRDRYRNLGSKKYDTFDFGGRYKKKQPRRNKKKPGSDES
jgi:hypothetical protein